MHKPVIRKFEKRKVYSSVIDNIWDADLADAINKQIVQGNYFFCNVLLIFSVNTHGLFLGKIKKVLQILMIFEKS